MSGGPKYGDFKFPSDFGFSGSSGEVRTVKPYTRRVPKFAKGGSVREVARQEVRKHIKAQPPQGHGVKPK